MSLFCFRVRFILLIVSGVIWSVWWRGVVKKFFNYAALRHASTSSFFTIVIERDVYE